MKIREAAAQVFGEGGFGIAARVFDVVILLEAPLKLSFDQLKKLSELIEHNEIDIADDDTGYYSSFTSVILRGLVGRFLSEESA